MKTKLDYKADSNPPHAHMDILIETLLAHGNKLARDYRWHNDMAARVCLLTEPIDFNLIEQQFDLPPNIRLTKERDIIECDETWTAIQGGAGKKL